MDSRGREGGRGEREREIGRERGEEMRREKYTQILPCRQNKRERHRQTDRQTVRPTVIHEFLLA